MTVARSARDVLTDHVVFEVDCVDRMYCNVYVPQLQYAVGLIGYLQRRLGLPIASTAPLAKITDAFSTAVHRFARDTYCRRSTSRRASARTMSCTSTYRLHRRGGCVVHRAGAGEDQAVSHRAPPRRQWRFLPVDSGLHWGGQPLLFLLLLTTISARSSSSSAPTFRITPSCASTATTGRSARPPRPASRSSRWTTGSPRSRTPRRYRRSAIGSDPSRSTHCCASGWPSCRIRLAPRIAPPATATTSRSCRPSSR